MRNLKIFAFFLILAAFALIHEPAAAKRPKTAEAEQTRPPKRYAWEEQRDSLLPLTDMVLCYGGSHHRNPYRWDRKRLTPYVTYTDREGKEHWLFDSFLCLEFVSEKRFDGQAYSYGVGYNGLSAGKKQWQELIDYWFADNSGVNALEKTVGEAAQRLGAPATKRKVVMVIPDPIIYRQWKDTTSTTAYWGSLDERPLDFASGEDRVAAAKWFVDRVRERFDQANYRYIELAGFYLISEDIVTPNEGWSYELKKSDEFVPGIAEYVHALNERLCWIPYNRAAGYKAMWYKLGVDYACMQPNHYWDDKGERPLSRYFADLKRYPRLGMEFEFEESLVEGHPNCEVYKARFREYMANAKKYGIYGTRPLSYYHGTNGFYDLWASPAEKDRELYHEFCRFVIDNPLRK